MKNHSHYNISKTIFTNTKNKIFRPFFGQIKYLDFIVICSVKMILKMIFSTMESLVWW